MRFLADIEFQLRKFADYGTIKYVSSGKDTGDMILVYPVKFSADEFEGTIDFGLKLTITKDKSTKEKNMWRIDLDYAKNAILTDFKCSDKNCEEIK
jgi:hypothetical protein